MRNKGGWFRNLSWFLVIAALIAIPLFLLWAFIGEETMVVRYRWTDDQTPCRHVNLSDGTRAPRILPADEWHSITNVSGWGRSQFRVPYEFQEGLKSLPPKTDAAFSSTTGKSGEERRFGRLTFLRMDLERVIAFGIPLQDAAGNDIPPMVHRPDSFSSDTFQHVDLDNLGILITGSISNGTNGLPRLARLRAPLSWGA